MAQKSIPNQIEEARVIIRNASGHPEIRKYLTTLGYDLKNLKNGKALLEQVTLLKEVQKDQYKDRHHVNQTYKAETTTVKETFEDHFTLARMAFRKDEASIRSLGLYQARATKRVAWLAQVNDFYTELLKHPEPMAYYNVDQTQLEQAKAAVEALIDLRDQRLEKKGDSESATQKRNASMKALREWVRDFKIIARVALRNDPQLLEVLGIAVSSPTS